MFQISQKSDLRMRLQELVSSDIPELSTSIIDESKIDLNLHEDSGKFLIATFVDMYCFSALLALFWQSSILLW